jgi:zinc protease
MFLYSICELTIRFRKCYYPYYMFKFTRNIFVPFAIAILVFFPEYTSDAGSKVPEYHKEVLDNGATIVCSYLDDSPIVTVQVRVLSGLSNEGRYAGSGISHFLEHLLFKGTRRKSSSQITREIKAMGGTVNGSTGLDSAEYHITVPNEYFADALSLIVEMVMEPVFTEAEMDSEREVILREINLREDSPSSRQMRILFEQAYRQNVYRYPIIGYKELVKSLRKDEVLEYHESVYTPERIVLGVSGGIEPSEAIALGRKKIEGYDRGRVWENVVMAEPRQVYPSISTFPSDVIVGYMAIGFHGTSLYSPDLYPTDVLSIVLATGKDSLLYNRIVKDKQLLYSISSFNVTPKYPGLFLISGIGEPEKLDMARDEIFAAINEFKSKEVNDTALERAKNLVISAYLRAHESTRSIASSMTSSQLMTGDASFFAKYVDEIKDVTPADVNVAAWRYLHEDNSTTVYTVPDIPEAVPPDVVQPLSPEDAGVEEGRLSNGLRVIAKRKGSLPLVSVTFAARGGLLAENEKDNGISNLTASMMLKGTRKRTEAEIEPAIERMGGDISSFSGMNSIGLAMSVMSEDMKEAMDIFHDVITGSIFPEEELVLERRKIISAIKEQDKDIFSVTMRRVRKLLYGEHPYSMRTLGEIDALEDLTRADLAAFYAETGSPENSVVTVVGDINPVEVIEDLTRRFSSWTGKAAGVRSRRVKELAGVLKENVLMRKQQAVIAIAFQGVDVNDDRKYALDIISSLLSGADGILFHSAREDKALAYATGAVNQPNLDRGYFVLYIATTQEDLPRAKKTLLGAIDTVKEGALNEEDISSSRKKLITGHDISLETNSAVSMVMALDELYGLGAEDHERYSERISSVTTEDIVRVAGEILNTRRAVIVEVHSEK